MNIICLITSEPKLAQQLQIPHLFKMEKNVSDKIFDSERRGWDSFCEVHPDMNITHSCLECVSSFGCWSLANQFLDLVSRFHVQVTVLGNFVFLKDTMAPE